jgi:hypothetical protein
MSDDLHVFNDMPEDSDGAWDFIELIADFFRKDPYALTMGDWITRIIISSSKKHNNKAKLAELISNEYDIDMTEEDFHEVKTLAQLWKFIQDSLEEDKFIPNEEMDE